MPFIIVPCAMWLSGYLDKTNLIKMTPYLFFAILGIVCLIMGNLTPTKRKFDLIMTAIMPLSFFCTMFVGGFLDKSDLETSFHLYRAVEVAFQPLALTAYLMMAVLALGASFKAFRISKRIKAPK